MSNLKELRKNTIKKLEELKDNLSYDNEENYCNMVNTLIDYDNEAQDNLYLYDNVRDYVDFVDEELLQYYVEYQFKEFGIDRLFYMTRQLENADTIYVVDGYGNLRNCEKSDFEYCIEETIERLEEALKDDEEKSVCCNCGEEKEDFESAYCNKCWEEEQKRIGEN